MPERRPTPNHLLYDVAEALALDNGGHFYETHPRFSLAADRSAGLDVIVTEPRSGQRDRLLVVKEVEGANRLYDQLRDGGVPQFHRHTHKANVFMYRVPLQAKPLAEERLFSGHVSSETYISDTEIFERLGKLWGTIHKLTYRLPDSAPLRATALQDFVEADTTLVPVPPYSFWQEVPDQHAAKTLFSDAVAHELQTMNPMIPHASLLQAVEKGWSHGNTD